MQQIPWTERKKVERKRNRKTQADRHVKKT